MQDAESPTENNRPFVHYEAAFTTWPPSFQMESGVLILIHFRDRHHRPL